MKVLCVILDGLGDKSYAELNGRTPLEAARTPNLDRLAAGGINGVMFPFGPGIAPSSDIAHFRLFGYPARGYPARGYPGRGYIEALGEGYDVKDDEVVFRTSFVTVEESGDRFTVTSRERENEDILAREAAGLIKDKVIEDARCRFVYTGARQGLLFVSGDVSPDVSDADSLSIDMPVILVEPLDITGEPAAARRTADTVNRFMLLSAEALRDQPLNFLITKWPGRPKKIPSFYNLTSFNGAIVANGSLYKGLASALGMGHFPSAEGQSPEDALSGGLEIARKLFKDGFGFVHVHSKVPDQAGHTKNPEYKKTQIERLDKAFEAMDLDRDTLCLITGDHATPCAGRMIHSGDAVPILMTGALCGADDVKSYSEKACRAGALGMFRGKDLMPLILNYTDRANYHGLRPYPFSSNARPTPDRVNPLKPQPKQ
ncbi:MAG: alkaline phosphatase family protein [Actinomycetota bacterium]